MLGKTYHTPKFYTVFPWVADIHHRVPDDLEEEQKQMLIGLGRSFDPPTKETSDAALAAYVMQTQIVAEGGYTAGGAVTVAQRRRLCLPLSNTDDRHQQLARGENPTTTAEVLGITEDLLEGKIASSVVIHRGGKMSKKEKKKRNQNLRDAAAAAERQESLTRQSRARGSGDPVSGESSLDELQQAVRLTEARKKRDPPPQKARPQQKTRPGARKSK